MLYTAGTSEKQKGVMLSHENLLRTASATAEVLGMTSSDVTLCTVPLFNIFGLGGTGGAIQRRLSPVRWAAEARSKWPA